MTRRQQQIGKQGEQLAETVLRLRGVNLVQHIGTPVHLIPHPTAKKYFRVIWGERVAGDRRGVLDDGTSVLAEVKTVLNANLRWSDFRDHQPGQLSDHAVLAVSLVVWVHSSGVYVMRWPIDGFGRGKSITPDRARELDVQDLRD